MKFKVGLSGWMRWGGASISGLALGLLALLAPGRELQAAGPWPPAGVVLYSRNGSPDGTIWLAAANGSADVQLTTGEWPRLSADGRYLVFHRGNSTFSRADVWVRDLTTGTETRIFSNPDYVVSYDWTRDGSKIVFDYSCDIRQMNRDGSGIATIIPASNCYDDAPAVNPVDGRLVFHNIYSGLWIANADGSGRALVPNTTGGATPEMYPVWSADGASIAFEVGNSYAVIKADGTGRTDLLAAAGVTLTRPLPDAPAAWSVDGNWLIFGATINGTNGLFAVATDGSGALQPMTVTPGAALIEVGDVSTTLSLANTANLTLALTAAPVAAVGQPLVLTATVQNSGPAVATNTVVTNLLPAGVRYVSATSSRGSASVAADGSIVGSLGNLAKGDSATVAVTVVPTNALFLTFTATAATQSPSYAGPQSASAAVLALVGTVGTISVPGDTDTYIFSLPTPQRYYFDALYAPANTLWTLVGPEGTVVNGRSFAGSDSLSIGDASAVLNLVPGSYTLTVDLAGSATNSYGFNFMNLADAPLLTLGTTNYVDFTPATRTWQWQFPANSGDAVQFTAVNRTNMGNLNWRLVNPQGQVVYNAGFQNSPVVTLTGTGTWTLLLEGYFYNTGEGNCAFVLTAQGNTPPTLPAGTAFNVGDLVTNTLAANTTNVHRFTVTQPVTVVWDSRTNAWQLSWTLVGPFGQVGSGNFRDSDSYGNAPIWSLPVGDYALSVTGYNGYTGDYGFRLFDFASATPMGTGTNVTGTLSPATATTGYQLSITAGERLFFNSPGGFPGSPFWVLVDPNRSVVFSNYLNSDQGPFTFTVPGLYTLLLEGNIYDTTPVTYSFLVSPVTDGSQALVLGATVNGNIGQPGQVQRYTFSLAQPTRVYFDSLTNQNQATWTLDGPAGRLVDHRGLNYSDGYRTFSFYALPAGDYTLSLAGNGDQTPGYSFRLLNAANATSIATDTDVTGPLNPANSTTILSLNITAGARFYFNSARVARGSAYWRLVDPYNQVVFADYLNNDEGPFVFTNASTYLLFIEGDVPETGADTYGFHIFTDTDGAQPLTIGATVNGTIATPAQVQRYSFTLTATNLLYFDSLTNRGDVQWTLDGPAGRIVDHRAFSNSDGYLAFSSYALAPGSYTLSVNGSGDAIGGYQFRLLDLGAGTAIATDTPITRTLNPANSTDVLQFAGTAGAKLFFNMTATGVGNTYWRLLDPYGQVVFADWLLYDQGPIILSFSGTYTLLIEGDVSAAGTQGYAFQINTDNDGSQALSVGSTINGSIATPGQAQRYNFTLAAAKLLYFDALLRADNLQWTLDGPLGRVVDHRGFNNSDGLRGQGWLSLYPGAYVLTMTAPGDNTGAFSFRLLDFAAATAKNEGDTVSGTLNPATSTDLYQFTAAAGDQVNFTAGPNPPPTSFWRLLDPSGNAVFSDYLSNTKNGVTLAAAGAYTLLIEGDIYQNPTNAAPYSFGIVLQGNTPPPALTGTTIAIGATVNDTNATASATNFYNFTLGTTTRLIFDVLSTANSFNWSLRGPQGLVVNQLSFYYSDYHGSQNPMWTLPAGGYQLWVTGDTGPYAFRLLDLATATPFSLGAAVAGTNTPANASTLWSFNATAQQSLYYAVGPSSGFTRTPYVIIYTPFGTELTTFPAVNNQPLVMPVAGTYVVDVSTAPEDLATNGTYGFTLGPINNGTQPLAIGATVNGALTSAGQKQFYTFSLTSPARLTFDALTNAPADFTLTGPTGTLFNRSQFLYSDWYGQKFADCPPGNYTVTIDADGATTTPFSFRLLDFASATPITVGTEVNTTNTPANGTALFTFNGNAGDRLFFDGRAWSGYQQQPRGWLYAPSGNQVITDYIPSADGPFTLPETGRYVWWVSSLPYDTAAAGTCRFAFLPVVDGTNSLALGATISGAITSPGQRQLYLFTLATPKRLHFDTLSNQDFLWSLYGPTGTVVNQTSAYYSDYYNGTPWLDLPAGSYTLAADLNGNATNAFRFRLLDFASATPFTPGQPTVLQFTPGVGSVLSSFTANAGDEFYFQWIARSGFVQSQMATLVSPLGQVVFRTGYGSDANTFAVPQTGTYTLVFAPNPEETAAQASLTFDLIPQPPSTPVSLFQTLTAPDLIVTDVSATPASGLLTGQSLTVNWTDRNTGKAAVNSSFTDRVTIRNPATGTLLVNRVLFNDVTVTGPLAAGGSLPRSLAVALPDGPAAAGTLQVDVFTDTLNNIPEANDQGTGEANNSAATTISVALANYPDLRVVSLAAVPPNTWAPGTTLNLSWTTTNAGLAAAVGPWTETVNVRNLTLGRVLFSGQTNDTAGPLAADDSRARTFAFTLPATGDAYGLIEIAVTTDSNNDVFEYLPGLDAETNNLTVLDVSNPAPALSLALTTNVLVKGNSLVATVTRSPALAVPLLIQITSGDSSRLAAQGTLTLPPGVPSATFTVLAVQNQMVEGTNTFSLGVSAAGFLAAATNVVVEDASLPAVTLSLAAHVVSEAAGPNATSATVTRSPVSPRPLNLAIVSANPAAALVPANVTIPAGQASASFPVAAVNDGVVAGDRMAAIGGSILSDYNGQPIAAITPDVLTVTEANGPALFVKLATGAVREGLVPATTATVSRNTAPTNDLLVGLASSDLTSATVPATVTIPNGAASATFNVNSVSNSVAGNRSVTLTASAAGYSPGNATLVVTDSKLPDLVVSRITFPTNGVTAGNLAVTFRLENRGFTAVTNAFVQRVFLSSQALAGTGTLAQQVPFSGTLPPGSFADLTANIRLPDSPGYYWVIVTADANNDIVELLEDNNTLVSSASVNVQPAYLATVAADIHQAIAGTPIPLHGSATLGGTGGQPAAFEPVTVYLAVRGIQRSFNALTDANGHFTNLFEPLPTEAGDYSIAATFPGQPMPAAQDHFVLLGMQIQAVGLVTVTQGSSVSGTTKIDNLSEVPLTGLNVQVVTNHPSLSVTANLSTNSLDGNGEITLAFGITALNTSAAESGVVLQVTSQEGVTNTLSFRVRQQLLLPQLVATPGSLNGAMLRGGQTLATFTLANIGGAETGPLNLLAPNLPWISISSPSQLATLAPGSNTLVTVLFTPPADLPLGNYNGTLVVNGTNASLAVPFNYQAISDGRGSLLLTAEDEYTYFAAGSPRVTNALVVLNDALTGTPVVTNVTGLDGSVLFSNLTEAFYLVNVTADNHEPFKQSAFVAAGMTTNVVAFLPRETVSYTFTVVPTTVADQYTITVDSTFETQVPVPVVTVDPPSVDLSQYPGAEFQFTLTLANHGLIAANHVQLNIPSTSLLQFMPLITNIGTLTANSSITVPILVKRLQAPSPQNRVKPENYLTGQCDVTAGMLWDYLCGPNVVDKSTAVYIFDSTGCDVVSLYNQVYHLEPKGGGGGGGGSSTFDAGDLASPDMPTLSYGPPPGFHFECNQTRPASVVKPGSGVVVRDGRGVKPAGVTGDTNAVCAKVTLQLDQRAVLTRDAFKATLQLVNDTESALQNVLVNLNIQAADGSSANAIFGLQPPGVSGFNAVDGTGTLPGQTTGIATWILIPTLDASPTNGSTLYLVGGTMSYLQDGTQITVPIAPAPIQVFPQPELIVKYFHQRDVFADDPFTPAIEPSLPYSLAVQVLNVGYGTARSLQISSGKPQIVDNVKGLLVDFKTIGTQIENQPISPALDVNLGDIVPATNRIARWLFTSSVQGSFTNFSASFQQVDSLGLQRLSLIRSVEIHELNHLVEADRTFEDGRPDMLVADHPDVNHLPDTLYLSDGTTTTVTSVTNGGFSGDLTVTNRLTVTVSAPTGWTYFLLPNPADTNQFVLQHVVRQDGSEIAFGTNAWTTDRAIIGGATRPVSTNQIHVLDFNSAGTYTLVYAPVAAPVIDTTPPLSAIAALPATSPARFAVSWSGTDDLSGIAFFDVYVSVNGGPFTQWLAQTSLNGSVYGGQPGGSYAFYSVATDNAGNLQPTPAAAQAQTSVSATSNPPTLTLGPNLVLNAGDTLNFFAQGQNGTPPLNYALLSGTPAGVLITPTTGGITWHTSPSDGGTTNTITVSVSDSSSPALSATNSVQVIIRAVNTAPQLAAIPNFTIKEGQPLLITNLATDADLPPQTLTFTLGPGAPAAATIDPSSGVFSWVPSFHDGPSTNFITVVVMDNGLPPMSDSQTFTVVVRKPQAQITLLAGSTNVLVGGSSSVPLTIVGDPAATQITFALDVAASRLGSLALQSLGSDVVSASLVPEAGDRSLLQFTLTGTAVDFTRSLAQLSFDALPNVHSAIMPLNLADLAGQASGIAYTNTLAVGGTVIVIGAEPVLWGNNPPSTLTVFGQPGVAYSLDTAPGLEPPVTWSPFGTVTVDPGSTFKTVPVTPPNQHTIIRAHSP
jgi:uncharacterized repeat protein (TIGR01451 family)